MDRPPITKFEESEESFAECVAFWERLFFGIAASTQSASDWRVSYADRANFEARRRSEPLEDRVTFEGYSPSLRRLVQVYQGVAPNSNEADLISVALKEIPLPPDDGPEVLALLIFLVLADATVVLAENALSAFLNPDASRESLLRLFLGR
jgi:hypothetical protein